MFCVTLGIWVDLCKFGVCICVSFWWTFHFGLCLTRILGASWDFVVWSTAISQAAAWINLADASAVWSVTFIAIFAPSFVNLSALYSSFSFIGPLGKLNAGTILAPNVITESPGILVMTRFGLCGKTQEVRGLGWTLDRAWLVTTFCWLLNLSFDLCCRFRHKSAVVWSSLCCVERLTELSTLVFSTCCLFAWISTLFSLSYRWFCWTGSSRFDSCGARMRLVGFHVALGTDLQLSSSDVCGFGAWILQMLMLSFRVVVDPDLPVSSLLLPLWIWLCTC